MIDALHEALNRHAVGPEVRLRIGAHDGPDRTTLVCRALDAATFEAYERLTERDPSLARRHLAGAVVDRFEGVDISREIAEFGSLGLWFLRHPWGSRLADDLVPEYLEVELPEQEDLDAVQFAAYAILDEQSPDRNPYEQDHREGCGHEIWADRDEWKLLDPMQVDPDVKASEGKCRGCLADRKLYLRIIKAQGTGEWVSVARGAFARSRLLEQFPPAFAITSARDWLYVEIVRSELAKREAYLNWQSAEKSREQAKSAGKGAR